MQVILTISESWTLTPSLGQDLESPMNLLKRDMGTHSTSQEVTSLCSVDGQSTQEIELSTRSRKSNAITS
jgi:hypothetical protein